MVAAGKIIPAEMIVRMLRKIIYSGDGRNKFILSSFPDIIEQAKEFEKSCSQISAIIYTSAANEQVVEIKNNNLTLFNIDALFQKEFRLKTMSGWSDTEWQEMSTSEKADWYLCLGKPGSGVTTTVRSLAKHFSLKAIEWPLLEEAARKKLGTEEEPFAGTVPF